MPQMPTPLRNNQIMATISIDAPTPAMASRISQPSGVRGVSTMREIFFVTDGKPAPAQ